MTIVVRVTLQVMLCIIGDGLRRDMMAATRFLMIFEGLARGHLSRLGDGRKNSNDELPQTGPLWFSAPPVRIIT